MSVSWRYPLSALLLLCGAVHAPPATNASPAALLTLHAQPGLLKLAATRPNQQIPVIVQEVAHASGLVRQVARLGGHWNRDLSIIHAFAAVMPAHAIATLAASPSVRWISRDAAVTGSSYTCCSGSTLQTVFPQAVRATTLWGAPYNLQGQQIGIAVVDSGFNYNNDFNSRVVYSVNINAQYHHHTTDLYGHGTHVAGIIAGDGNNASGAYVGVAPQASLFNVRVADDNGAATISDVVNGLQWVYNNAHSFNVPIRIVNLSLNSTAQDSYQVDPLDAAVETLWQNGIVVVVSAGNNGSSNAGVMFAPADDPFVITVGAVDDQASVSSTLHTLASFSAFGTVPVSTTAGLTTVISKPDLVAPGVNIISDLASSTDTLATAHPANIVGTSYFMMSGTSMAAPMVAGAAALLLQSNPSLTPTQVKYRLMASAAKVGLAVTTLPGTGAGEVDATAAVQSTATGDADAAYAAAASLQPGNPAASWTSASWGSASWGSASWGSASWGSASWGSASWGSASWGSASWGSDYWGTVRMGKG